MTELEDKYVIFLEARNNMKGKSPVRKNGQSPYLMVLQP